MITIGSTKIKTNIFMSPMSGCTDLSFRLIARELGAKFCFFEMIDSNSLVYCPKTDVDILRTIGSDVPIAAQLVGSDIDIMEKAAIKLLDLVKIKFLDINAACPVKKILKKKAGAYFMKDPEGLYKIIKKFASSLPVPITVKLRTGYHKRDIDSIVAIARNCQKNGASALFIHGRTQKQGYSGEIDYEAIKAVKQSVKIPVFGSGNIMDPIMAKKMLDETDCDGIMVARGALGNPWIFRNIENYLNGNKTIQPITLSTRINILKNHLRYIDKYKVVHPSSKIGVMRKVSLWYLREFPNACKIRGVVNSVPSYEKLLELLDSISGSNP